MRDKPTFGRDTFRLLFKHMDWEGGWESDRFCRWLQLGVDGVYVVPPPSEIARHLSPTELTEVEKHPRNNLTVPALSFPFTLDEFDEFLEFFGLDSFCDMKLFMEMAGKIFPLERIAKILEIEQFEIIAATQARLDQTTKQPRPVLQASAYFNNPMKLYRNKVVCAGGDYGWGAKHSTFIEDLYGLFDLCFLRQVQPDSDGRMTVHFLVQDGITYSSTTGNFFVVNVSELVFTFDNLREYLRAIGRDTSIIDKIVVEHIATPDSVNRMVIDQPKANEHKSIGALLRGQSPKNVEADKVQKVIVRPAVDEIMARLRKDPLSAEYKGKIVTSWAFDDWYNEKLEQKPNLDSKTRHKVCAALSRELKEEGTVVFQGNPDKLKRPKT